MRRVLLVFVAVSLSAQTGLTPEAERGRQIYERGTSPSDSKIEASLGEDTRVAGSVLPCANCHGQDGKGKAESGVFPSDITWNALTKPYQLANPAGRTHPPYTERLLRRAITMGIDPAGNTLDIAMPRFQMSSSDALDLVAYIKKLGDTTDPGLTATTVRLGVILPPPSPTEQTAAIVRQTMLDYFTSVNGVGGIFGRRVELAFTELPADPTQRADAVRAFLAREQVFAVLGDFSGAEPGIAAAMRDTETPAIAVLAPIPQTASPLNRFVFYLDGGIEEEEQALLDFASAKFPGMDREIAIIDSDDETSRETAKWLQASLAKTGRQRILLSEDIQAAQADIVFWIRPGLPPAIQGSRVERAILIPGSLAAGFSNPGLSTGTHIFVALGTGSYSQEQIPDAHNDSSRMIWERTTASASILTEALKNAGRGLSRTTLLEALESFNGVQTNLPGPITFGPNRRVGASHVRVMRYDPVSRKLEPIDRGIPPR